MWTFNLFLFFFVLIDNPASQFVFVCLMVFNATFNNISFISWRTVLLLEETGGPRENLWPVASHWQTLSHNVVLLALIEIRTHNIVVIGTDCIVVNPTTIWSWPRRPPASQIWVLNYIHQMIPEWQKCPDVTFTYGSKEYHSTADLMTFHSHYRVWVLIIIEDPTVTVKCRTAIKVLFLYFNLCTCVMFDNLLFIYIHTQIKREGLEFHWPVYSCHLFVPVLYIPGTRFPLTLNVIVISWSLLSVGAVGYFVDQFNILFSMRE